jgi:hypothetical protein
MVDSKFYSMNDDLDSLAKRLTDSTNNRTFVAALDDITAYLTHQKYKPATGCDRADFKPAGKTSYDFQN